MGSGSRAAWGRWCFVQAVLEKTPPQWGQCYFTQGYGNGSSSWASQSPGSCSCMAGFICHFPPSFQSASEKPLALSSAGCQCPGWSSDSSCIDSYIRLQERKKSLKYVLLRIPAELLWIFPAEEILVRAAVFPGVPQWRRPHGEGRIEASLCLWGKFSTHITLSHQAWLQQVSRCSYHAFVPHWDQHITSTPCYILLKIFLPSELSWLLFFSLCGPSFCGITEGVLKCIFTESPPLIALVLEDNKWERKRSRSVG